MQHRTFLSMASDSVSTVFKGEKEACKKFKILLC